MPRQARLDAPGTLHHVIIRGIEQGKIVDNREDRQNFVSRMGKVASDTGTAIYAWALMPNHLLIETPNVTLSKIMQRINLTYTQYFNRKYDKVGHLFQGRYKSFLCDRDGYLLSLVRYIHLNPVRAKVVKEPQEYQWSSHNDYLAGTRGFVDTTGVLRLFSERISQARRRYRDFVNEALREGRDESFYRAVGQQILGDDEFIQEVEKRTESLGKPLRRPSLQEILKAVKEVTGIAEEEMVSRGRSRELMSARGILVGVWRAFGYRLVDLQPSLRRDVSVLSRWSRISEHLDGRKAMEQVLKIINARLQT